jgi:hypothetical protein
MKKKNPLSKFRGDFQMSPSDIETKLFILLATLNVLLGNY